MPCVCRSSALEGVTFWRLTSTKLATKLAGGTSAYWRRCDAAERVERDASEEHIDTWEAVRIEVAAARLDMGRRLTLLSLLKPDFTDLPYLS